MEMWAFVSDVISILKKTDAGNGPMDADKIQLSFISATDS